MFNENPILYTPKLFDKTDFKSLIVENLANLTLEQFNTTFHSYQSLISLFGIEFLILGDNVYIKPARSYKTNYPYDWSKKCFGVFETKKAVTDKCTCQIFIEDSKIAVTQIEALIFFMEDASKTCKCGRKISHHHCLLCGKRTSYRKPLFRLKQDEIRIDNTILDGALKELESYFYCSNCTERTPKEEVKILFPNIPDLLSRIKPGQVLPEGQCSCGGLLYKNEKDIPDEL